MYMVEDVEWDETFPTPLMMCCSGWGCWNSCPLLLPFFLCNCSRNVYLQTKWLKTKTVMLFPSLEIVVLYLLKPLSLIAFLLSLLELDIGRSPAYSVLCDSKVHNAALRELRFPFVCFCTCSWDDDDDGLLNLKLNKHLCPYIMLVKVFQVEEFRFFSDSL